MPVRLKSKLPSNAYVGDVCIPAGEALEITDEEFAHLKKGKYLSDSGSSDGIISVEFSLPDPKSAATADDGHKPAPHKGAPHHHHAKKKKPAAKRPSHK